jgi:hypothetical protein
LRKNQISPSLILHTGKKRVEKFFNKLQEEDDFFLGLNENPKLYNYQEVQAVAEVKEKYSQTAEHPTITRGERFRTPDRNKNTVFSSICTQTNLTVP